MCLCVNMFKTRLKDKLSADKYVTSYYITDTLNEIKLPYFDTLK